VKELPEPLLKHGKQCMEDLTYSPGRRRERRLLGAIQLLPGKRKILHVSSGSILASPKEIF